MGELADESLLDEPVQNGVEMPALVVARGRKNLRSTQMGPP